MDFFFFQLKIKVNDFLRLEEKCGSNSRHLILYLLQLKPPFPNNDDTWRSRTGLEPSYGNTLVERCFRKKEKSSRNPKGAYAALSLHM